jgi:hypothetical protein
VSDKPHTSPTRKRGPRPGQFLVNRQARRPEVRAPEQPPEVTPEPLLARPSLRRLHRALPVAQCDVLADQVAEEVGLGQDLGMDERPVRLQRDAGQDVAAQQPQRAGHIAVAHAEQQSDRQPGQVAAPTQPARQRLRGRVEQQPAQQPPAQPQQPGRKRQRPAGVVAGRHVDQVDQRPRLLPLALLDLHQQPVEVGRPVTRVAQGVEEERVPGLGHRQAQGRPLARGAGVPQQPDARRTLRQFRRPDGGLVGAGVIDQQDFVVAVQAVEVGAPVGNDGFQVGRGVVGQQDHAERLRRDRRQGVKVRHVYGYRECCTTS